MCEKFWTLPADGTHSGRRNKDALPAKLVAGSHLPISGKLQGKILNRLLCDFIHTVFEIGLLAADIKQRLDASGAMRCLITVKGVSGKSHDPTGFGNIAQFCREVEKSGLVLDDVLVKAFHLGTPLGMVPG